MQMGYLEDSKVQGHVQALHKYTSLKAKANTWP